MFGSVQSLFIVEGKIDNHPYSYTEKFSAEVAEIRDGLYVNDLIAGGENFEQVASLKDAAIDILYEAGFKLHKWHSNIPALTEK